MQASASADEDCLSLSPEVDSVELTIYIYIYYSDRSFLNWKVVLRRMKAENKSLSLFGG